MRAYGTILSPELGLFVAFSLTSILSRWEREPPGAFVGFTSVLPDMGGRTIARTWPTILPLPAGEGRGE